MSETSRQRSPGLLTFARVPADEPPASDLIEAMVAEVSELYGERIDAEGKPTAAPDELTPPNGACVVGYLDGEPVTVGAVKRLEDGIAEIKRMYVAPAGRSRGVARALLLALEAAARELGYSRVRLDTGTSQPHAKALYLSDGVPRDRGLQRQPIRLFLGREGALGGRPRPLTTRAPEARFGVPWRLHGCRESMPISARLRSSRCCWRSRSSPG